MSELLPSRQNERYGACDDVGGIRPKMGRSLSRHSRENGVKWLQQDGEAQGGRLRERFYGRLGQAGATFQGSRDEGLASFCQSSGKVLTLFHRSVNKVLTVFHRSVNKVRTLFWRSFHRVCAELAQSLRRVSPKFVGSWDEFVRSLRNVSAKGSEKGGITPQRRRENQGMLSWIKVQTELPEHPKIYRLRQEMKFRKNFEAVGLLVCLWLWAANHAPDGKLSRFPPEAIAKAVQIRDGGRLLEALRVSGWVDETEDGGLKLHDWEEHAFGLMEIAERQRAQNRDRVRRYRARQREDAAQHAHGQGAEGGNEICNVTETEGNAPRGEERTEEEKREDREEMERTTTGSGGAGDESSSLWSLSPPTNILSDEQVMEWVQGQLEALSPAGKQELRQALKEHGGKKCMEAVCIAMDQGRPVWRYVRGVLNNWRAEGQYSGASPAPGDTGNGEHAGGSQRQLRAFLQSLKEEPEKPAQNMDFWKGKFI